MASVFSEDLRIQNAANFKDLVSRQISNNRVFFTYGKSTTWANDAAPDQANTSVTTFNDVWKNMIGAKLLTGNEVKHVVPRNDWSANTIYDAYDHCTCSLILFDANVKFYVVTSDWNVYKCLNNNNGAKSTVMPKQIFVDKAIEEADGYIWKYMYTIPAEDQLRFTTSSYIPVKYLTSNDGSLQWKVQQNAIEGAIESIKVTNSGSGYTNANTITITINGDGSGATATARVNTISNTITNIIITTKGDSYTYANVIISDTGSGTNAAARAIISPQGGHGSNALKELGANYLILNPRLSGTENDKFPTKNEFRQISLISNPYIRNTNNIASNVAYSQLTNIILDSAASEFLEDEIVYQGTSVSTASFTGIIENWDSGNNTLKLTNTKGTLQTDVIIGANSGTSRFVQSYKDKELQPYSGSLLYIDNIAPITRADDQIEDFKILMKF